MDVDEVYRKPENLIFIRIEKAIYMKEGSDNHVVYEIRCKSSSPHFNRQNSVVHRRYSDFVRLREILIQENPNIRIPDLPPRRILTNKFDSSLIEERKTALQEFLNSVCTHPLIQRGPSGRLVVSFLQE